MPMKKGEAPSLQIPLQAAWRPSFRTMNWLILFPKIADTPGAIVGLVVAI